MEENNAGTVANPVGTAQAFDPENYDAIIVAYKEFLKVARKAPKARKYIQPTEKVVKDLEDAKVIGE